MEILSVTGENCPPGKGGSPSDTFDRSIVTYQAGQEKKTLTVTYVRYFGKVLAERGIYDETETGVPLQKLVAILFLEKYPQAKETRHYINDTEQFLKLFEGFSWESFRDRYQRVLAT